MKKIYIAGCGGMLGTAFYSQFKDNYILKCTDKDVNESWLNFLDFRDFDEYKKDVLYFNPDYLFHLGAHTDLEYCEKNIEDTYKTNTTSVENAVYIANILNIPILYISSGGVFDGNKPAFDDWDIPNPNTVYGRSKYLGERFVVENAKRYLVCRAGWMMGGGIKDKKFVRKIKDQAGKKEIYVVNDKYGTPTYTVDFANTVRKLIESELWGVYNCVCEGQTSRLEVAMEIIRILGSETKIVEIGSGDMKDYFVERPLSECLLNSKLHLRGITMRYWKDALNEYMNG